MMGSGETAPTMAKVHRLLAERFGPVPVDAVLLDPPYRFQGNAEEISRRAVGYFGRTLQLPVRVASWRSPSCDGWEREQALASVRDADIVLFCYLGEQRLQLMEAMLDATTCVLGIDEHTAGVFDLDADTLSVLGRGAVTIRSKGISTVFDSGRTVGLDEVRAAATGNCSAAAIAHRSGGVTAAGHRVRAVPSLRANAQRLERALTPVCVSAMSRPR